DARPRILRRPARAPAVPLGSVLIASVAGAIIVAVTGGNPLQAYQALICGGFGLFCFGGEPSVLQLSNTLVFVTPLIMAGIAVALPFRAGMFNIGAEGQLIMGAILATTVGIHWSGLPAVLLIPLVLLSGALGGALWGGIVGVLKATTGAHEVVTTIMLNFVAQWFLRFLIIGGPLQLPGGSSKSSPIADSARLPTLLPHDNTVIFDLPGAVYRAHTGLFVALAAAAVFAFLLWRTSLGYEIRAVGQSQRAARYAGIGVRRTLIVTMLVAGARSEEHTSELQSHLNLVCRLLLEKKKTIYNTAVADVLGLDPIDITVVNRDTGLTPGDLGSHSRRGTRMPGRETVREAEEPTAVTA